MKLIIFFLLIFSVTNSYAQVWTEQELKIVEEFSLDIKDHRGVIFYNSEEGSCTELYESLDQAIVDFFMKTVKRDITKICVSQIDDSLVGVSLDIRELIQLYLTTKN